MAEGYKMPGDELGPCPCGHRAAMCHRVNAAKWCGASGDPFVLNQALDHLENFVLTDKIEGHMEKEEFVKAARFLQNHGRLLDVVVDDEDEDWPPRDWYGYA